MRYHNLSEHNYLGELFVSANFFFSLFFLNTNEYVF